MARLRSRSHLGIPFSAS